MANRRLPPISRRRADATRSFAPRRTAIMETPKSYHKTMLQVSPTGVELYPVVRNLSDSDEERDEVWSSETEDSDGSLPELPVLLPKRKSLATPPKPRSIAHRRSSSEGTVLIDRSDEPRKFGDKWVLTRQVRLTTFVGSDSLFCLPRFLTVFLLSFLHIHVDCTLCPVFDLGMHPKAFWSSVLRQDFDKYACQPG